MTAHYKQCIPNADGTCGCDEREQQIADAALFRWLAARVEAGDEIRAYPGVEDGVHLLRYTGRGLDATRPSFWKPTLRAAIDAAIASEREAAP